MEDDESACRVVVYRLVPLVVTGGLYWLSFVFCVVFRASISWQLIPASASWDATICVLS